MKFLDALKKVLSADKRFLGENQQIIKTKVSEAARSNDKKLLKALLKNDLLKESFFTKVDDIYVFDKNKFVWVLESKEFLPDSYTVYKNKVGLVGADYNLISQKHDISLVWPYKDCVLEGGQTKDDQKRNEIFYNEILAPDQVNRLLAPKVLSNAKRYTKDGVEENIEFKDDDNLIIKGNNLLALSSLLERYEGRVKCIYIDPPYNTGSDSFNYNDNFSKSTWLTFMKNRLNIAKKMLKKEGAILVSIDEKQQAYLKVLMDEMFGAENLLEVFHIQVRYTNKSLNEKDDFQPVMEYVLVYALDKKSFKPNKPYEDYNLNKFEWEINELTKGNEIEIGGKKVVVFKAGEYEIKKIKPNINGLKETWASGSVLVGNTSGKFFDQYLSKRKNIDGLKVLYKVDGIGEDGIGYRYFTGPKKEAAIRGKFYAGVPLDKRKELENGDARKYSPIVNYYDYSPDFGNIRHEGGVSFNSGKKPEKMLKMLFDFSTNEGDLILDYHIGSGSSCAVAHKMNRQYIGIEQMDYIEEKSVKRLSSVIDGDSTGISENVDWQGGGSFVYCELLEDNESLVTELEAATTSAAVKIVLNKAIDGGKLIPSVLPGDLRGSMDDFDSLSMDEQKNLVMELLNKNKLYVNLSDIDDEDYDVSEADKKFTRSFYGEE